jgi:hypothetical protein
MFYIATRSVLTGHLSEIKSVGDDIGHARKLAQYRADRMRANSVWLTTGNPTSKYSSVLETFPAARV